MREELDQFGRTPQQRKHLRRIIVSFAIIVVVVPLAGLGGNWGLLIFPLLVVAAFALREALKLRASARPTESPPEQ